jgi:hypothetical protein
VTTSEYLLLYVFCFFISLPYSAQPFVSAIIEQFILFAGWGVAIMHGRARSMITRSALLCMENFIFSVGEQGCDCNSGSTIA